MARLRSNNVFGTTTNAPLLIGGTTLNAAGLANLVAVAGADRAAITLDPNRVNGAPEIVWVSAHTGAATSATILRAQEGTSAREHPVGTFWVHAATAKDLDDLTADTGWVAVSTLGYLNGWVDFDAVSHKPYYRKVGNRIVFRGLIKSGTVGSSAFTMPAGSRPVVGTGYAESIYASASNNAFGQVVAHTNGNIIPTIGNNAWVSLATVSYLVD